MVDPQLFLIIALILLSTKVFSIFMRKVHLPQVVGALLAGVILGPAVFGLIEPSETLIAVAEFGVIFLLFAAGMETDFRELRKSLKASLLVSILGIVIALGGGFIAAFAFGNPTFESFFIGVVIASMSTSITVETLMEMGKLKTKSGTTIMGASLFDDIIVIIMLAIIMGRGEGEFSIGAMGILVIKIVLFFALAVGAGYFISKLFNFMHSKYGAKKRLSIFAIAYCFILAYLAEVFGLADITGAYLAGIAFCSTRCVDYLETKTHELSYMFFTPVFLAGIGLHISFDGITGNIILFTLLLTVVAIVSKVIGCGLGAKLSGFGNRESLQVGAGMVARGEVSFIVAGKGIVAGYINPQLFPSVIIVVLITVLITPFLLKAAYGRGAEEVES